MTIYIYIYIYIVILNHLHKKKREGGLEGRKITGTIGLTKTRVSVFVDLFVSVSFLSLYSFFLNIFLSTWWMQ